MLPNYNTFVATKLLIIVLLALVVMFQFIAAIGGGLILQKFENYKNLTFEDDQGNFTDDAHNFPFGHKNHPKKENDFFQNGPTESQRLVIWILFCVIFVIINAVGLIGVVKEHVFMITSYGVLGVYSLFLYLSCVRNVDLFTAVDQILLIIVVFRFLFIVVYKKRRELKKAIAEANAAPAEYVAVNSLIGQTQHFFVPGLTQFPPKPPASKLSRKTLNAKRARTSSESELESAENAKPAKDEAIIEVHSLEQTLDSIEINSGFDPLDPALLENDHKDLDVKKGNPSKAHHSKDKEQNEKEPALKESPVKKVRMYPQLNLLQFHY